MLQTLRNKAQSPFIQGIVLIIAVVFIFWGVGANMNSREAALVVNDDEITFERFRQVYNQVVNQYSAQFGGTIPKSLMDSLDIDQQVINQLVQESLLRQGAEIMGIRTSGEEVQGEIRKMTQFQKDGVFSMEQYKAILASNRYTPNKFENSMRLDMLSGKAVDNIGAFGSTITDYEIQNLYQLEKESVTLSYIRIEPKNYINTITPTETELNSYFETNKEKYKTAPQVKLKYISVPFRDLSSQLIIDDDAVKKRYEKDITKYQTKESRRARHILLSAGADADATTHDRQRKKAQDVLKLAKIDPDFAKLAQTYSEGPSNKNGGDLGSFEQGKMVKEFDNAVFSMKVGEISDVVKTEFGYHIIKLEAIVPAETKNLEDVKDSIVQTLQLEKAKPLAFEKANASYEGIITAGSLPAYSVAHPNITVHETELFARSNPPAQLVDENSLLERAFQLKKGELSSLIETGSGYAILFAEDIKEPAIPDLGDVQENVTADFKQDKATEKAKKVADDLLAKLKEGGDFEKEAAGLGLKIEDSGPLKKMENASSSFPSSLIGQSFRLSRLSPYPDQPEEVDGNFYLFKFMNRQIPKSQLTDTGREKYKKILQEMKQKRIIGAWLKMLEKDAKIYTNKNLNL